MIKLAAIGALALMVITVIICLIIYMSAPEPQQLILPGTPETEIPPPPGHGNDIIAIVSIIILIAVFVAVYMFSRRQQKE